MWKEKDNCLYQEWVFKDFVEAFAFMTEVALVAEREGHHPNWENVYNQVRTEWSTHDAGNIVTEKDRRLAELITDIARKYK